HSRTRAMGPLLESSLPLLSMHWDHEPTPIPSQEGNGQDADELLLPSGTCLARRTDLASAHTRLFRSRASVWSAATCRRCFPRAQANSLQIRPCREQKRQQVGALQTLLR